jgi:hypothetical protein
MRIAVPILLLCACGGGGGGGDDDVTAPDAAPPDAISQEQQCFGAWGPIAPVPGLDTEANELGPRLSPDERTVYITYVTDPNVPSEIAVAHRDSVDEPFGTPELIPAAQSDMRELAPSVSDDGLTLVFTRWDGGINENLWISTRESVDDDFGTAVQLTGLTGAQPRHGILSPDGTRLWYAAQEDVYVATRTGDTFGDAVAQQLYSYVYPIPSADELTIYYGSNDGVDTYRATRASTADAWSTPPDEVSPPHGSIVTQAAIATWVSPDGCRMYGYASEQATANVWMSTRAP